MTRRPRNIARLRRLRAVRRVARIVARLDERARREPPIIATWRAHCRLKTLIGELSVARRAALDAGCSRAGVDDETMAGMVEGRAR